MQLYHWETLLTPQDRISEENQLGRENFVSKTLASTQRLNSPVPVEELFCYIVWSAARLHIFIHGTFRSILPVLMIY